jgi:chromosome segregation ATPase
MMERQVADSRQEIEELKTRQAQSLLERSDLDSRLKEVQESARSSADLIKDLKSALAQLTQDNADLATQVRVTQGQATKVAEQLETSQTQMLKIAAQIKARQDQKAAPLVEQKRRAKLAIAAPAGTSGPLRQLAPKPRLQRAKPQTEDRADTQ